MPTKTALTSRAIDKVIRQNLKQFDKSGVLTVRPGFEVAGDQFTGKRAVVATVHTKKLPAGLSKSDLLPTKLSGVPVDVREATPHQRLRAHDPAAAALAQAFSRQHDREPVWAFEREIPSGKLVSHPPDTTRPSLLQFAAAHLAASQPAASKALAASAQKQHIPYVPAANSPLNPVNVTTTITAHVSPDAGLATLQDFLAGTKHSLVIGMYDFTSGHVLQSFLADLTGAKTLQMVLDNPALNDTADQPNAETIQELDAAVGNHSHIVRALDNMDVLVSAFIFPFAYHIKVIVRDNSAFWLSSGNLNNSNQPDLTSPIIQKRDRDWHVIVEDENLAKLFAAYLNQDFASAQPFQLSQPGPLAAAVSAARTKLAAETNPPPPPVPVAKAAKTKFVPAQVFTDVSVRVTPLLTPDRLPFGTVAPAGTGLYLTNITNLISSAQQTLFMQLQYFEASKGDGSTYEGLLQAIADRVAAGVDVRLIEDRQNGIKWAEKMLDQGVDLTANIRLQEAVHNKGFVVDSKTVVVSSQNFSPAGVETNRDAGLILESQHIAGYFEPIFLDDWDQRAKPFNPKAAALLPKPKAPGKGPSTKGSSGKGSKKPPVHGNKKK